MIFHHQPRMTRFALRRSNLFESFPGLQSHRTQIKKHSIARSMTWPMPRDHLLESLVSNAAPRNRETEALKAKARSAKRYRTGETVAA